MGSRCIPRVENWDDNLIIAIGLLEHEAQLFALIHVEIQDTLTFGMLFVLSMMYDLLPCEQDKINSAFNCSNSTAVILPSSCAHMYILLPSTFPSLLSLSTTRRALAVMGTVQQALRTGGGIGRVRRS